MRHDRFADAARMMGRLVPPQQQSQVRTVAGDDAGGDAPGLLAIKNPLAGFLLVWSDAGHPLPHDVPSGFL
jgi:hypothetical protein